MMMTIESFSNNFSIIKKSESMQTISDKQKYKSQQVFKVLSLSLDSGLELFSPLVNCPVNDAQSRPDLNQSLLQVSQVTYWLLVYTLLNATPDSVISGI